MKKNNKKISLDIPLEVNERLLKEASEKELTLSGYIRLIIKLYFIERDNDKMGK